MFFAPSRLFAIFCFWASLLWVIGSPVMPTQLEQRAGRSLLSGVNMKLTYLISDLKEPVKLWIYGRGSEFEHWALIIGSRAFHATIPDPKHEDANPLKAAMLTYEESKKAKLIDLDCTATFTDANQVTKVNKALVDIKMMKLPRETGGNCMDYVKDALKYLVENKNIPSVPSKFTKIFNSDYDKVQKEVWSRGV